MRGNVLLVDHGLTLSSVTVPIPVVAPDCAASPRCCCAFRLATPLEHAAEGTELPLILTAPITWTARYPGPAAVAALQVRRLSLQMAGAGFTALVVSPARASRLPKETVRRNGGD